MKKNILYLLIVVISIVLVACTTTNKYLNNTETNNLDNTDTNVIKSFFQSDYNKPNGPYKNFEFAKVYLNTGVENCPYEDYVDALWVSANLDSDEWNYDNYSKLTHFPTIYLVYNSKESLLLDFERIRKIVPLAETVSVYLHTINKEFDFKFESNIEDLKSLIKYYDGSEVEVEQLPFKQLYLSIDNALIIGYVVLDSFDAYIEFNPENLLELDEAFFIEKSVVFIGKDRSGSLEIRGVDRVFINEDGILEIAINGYSESQNFTEDIQCWTAAISVDKCILKDNNEIVIHYHITYGNGYLSDVPFHNTKDKKN